MVSNLIYINFVTSLNFAIQHKRYYHNYHEEINYLIIILYMNKIGMSDYQA